MPHGTRLTRGLLEDQMRGMRTLSRPAALLLGLGIATSTVAAAQTPATSSPAAVGAKPSQTWTAPRTPWGDPDLQGIWPSTDMVGVPFERPAELAGRTEVTNEEFAARTERAQKQTVADSEEFVSTAPRTGDGTGPPSHWLEHGKPSRQSSLVVAPADGKLPPMTPEGQRRAALNRNTYVMFSGFTDASDMGPYDRCITRGVMG